MCGPFSYTIPTQGQYIFDGQVVILSTFSFSAGLFKISHSRFASDYYHGDF